MAKTTLATGNAQTVKVWSEKVFRESRKAAYFTRMMGKEGTICTELTDLTKDKGDLVNVPFIQRSTAAGVTSGSTLEGAEDSLTFANYQLSLEQYRNALRDDGALTRKRAGFDLPAESQSVLKVWGGEKIDSLLFTAGQNAPTIVGYLDAGTTRFTATTTTASAALTATDLITPRLIENVKTFAKTGGNRRMNPLAPVSVGGKKYFVLMVHPDVGNDLRNDSTWAQAHREAMERSADNPIFQDALGIWGGVVVHEHENVAVYTNGGPTSATPYATCMFMGEGALAWAWGQREQVVYKTFDFDNEQGWAWGIIAGAGKPQFTYVSSSGSNTRDYGMLGFYVARTQISDITLS